MNELSYIGHYVTYREKDHLVRDAYKFSSGLMLEIVPVTHDGKNTRIQWNDALVVSASEVTSPDGTKYVRKGPHAQPSIYDNQIQMAEYRTSVAALKMSNDLKQTIFQIVMGSYVDNPLNHSGFASTFAALTELETLYTCKERELFIGGRK